MRREALCKYILHRRSSALDGLRYIAAIQRILKGQHLRIPSGNILDSPMDINEGLRSANCSNNFQCVT
jgi:hypothetical protein